MVNGKAVLKSGGRRPHIRFRRVLRLIQSGPLEIQRIRLRAMAGEREEGDNGGDDDDDADGDDDDMLMMILTMMMLMMVMRNGDDDNNNAGAGADG
eukprot:2722707-Pyramimonas_sp.AAC.1